MVWFLNEDKEWNPVMGRQGFEVDSDSSDDKSVSIGDSQ